MRLELREKQAADNNRNGAVGNIGKKMPITPSISESIPIPIKTMRMGLPRRQSVFPTVSLFSAEADMKASSHHALVAQIQANPSPVFNSAKY